MFTEEPDLCEGNRNWLSSLASDHPGGFSVEVNWWARLCQLVSRFFCASFRRCETHLSTLQISLICFFVFGVCMCVLSKFPTLFLPPLCVLPDRLNLLMDPTGTED